MGLASTFALGRNTKANVILEPSGSFGTYQGTSAASSLKVLSGMIKASEERKPRIDARASRSLLEQIKGRLTVEWNLNSYLLPRPSTDPNQNTPDTDPLWVMGLGVGSGTAPRVYTCSPSQSLPPSGSLTYHWNDTQMVAARGCVVDEVGISIPGGEEPTVEFTGKAVEHIKTAHFIHDGTAPISATTITPSPATDHFKVDVGSRFLVGTETVESVVSAVNRTTGLITFAPGLTASQAANTDVVPATQFDESNTGGSLVPAILGQLDIGAVNNVLLSAANISIKNNWKALDQVAFQRVVQDFIPGFREVSGEMTFWARREDLEHWAQAQHASSLNPIAVNIQLGSLTTGDAQILIAMPNVEFNFGELNIQGDEPGTFQLPFTALATTPWTIDDEITITYRDAP